MELQYAVREQCAAVIGRKGEDAEVRIPKTYQGLPVTEIGPEAFRDCLSLRRVILPECLETIGPRAFLNCLSLETIGTGDGESLFPAALKVIGNEAFQVCGLSRVQFQSSSLSLGFSAFQCASLTECRFAPGCRLHLSPGAFAGSSLVYFHAVDVRLDALPEYVFDGCEALQKVLLPDCPVQDHAFRNCSGLQTLSFRPASSEVFSGSGKRSPFYVSAFLYPMEKERILSRSLPENFL